MAGRDSARDVVRGLNALEMSFVNISNISWTNHSGYIDQPTYADTIFPFFTFLSGMSRVPTRRSVGLMGLGLTLQTVSAYTNGEAVRIPGVLQRIGLATLLANHPSCRLLRRAYGLPLIILWYAVSLALGGLTNPFAHPQYPLADPLNTAQTRIDTGLFGTRIYTPTHDPEGLLGSLTTAVSVLLGQYYITRGKDYRTVTKVLAAAAMIGTGESLHVYAPRYFALSKGLWTPSFVLVTTGYSILKYILAQEFTPMLPAVVRYSLSCVGRRSLEIYCLSTLIELALLHGGSKSVWNQGLAFLCQYMSRTLADFTLTSLFTGSMALSAMFMVRFSIRLNW